MRFSILLAGALLLVAAPGQPPISKSQLIDALREGGRAFIPELVQIVREDGVSFRLTPEDEKELKARGATTELIEAVRANYRPPAAAAPAVRPGPPLEKNEIITLLRAMAADQVEPIVLKRGVAFALTPEIKKEIEAAGGNQSLLDAIRAKAPEAPSPPVPAAKAVTPPAPPAPAAPTPSGPPKMPAKLEPGVYYNKGGQWTELTPEAVSWKSLSRFKTLGRKRFKGSISGLQSRTAIKAPLEFLIYTPEEAAISYYQLMRLTGGDEYNPNREFRPAVAGETVDLLPFEPNKIGDRTYLVRVPNPGLGEYGFLPPGTNPDQPAKMYTFRVGE